MCKEAFSFSDRFPHYKGLMVRLQLRLQEGTESSIHEIVDIIQSSSRHIYDPSRAPIDTAREWIDKQWPTPAGNIGEPIALILYYPHSNSRPLPHSEVSLLQSLLSHKSRFAATTRA